MKVEHLIVLADASPELGAGHQMRTLGLAEARREAGRPVSLLARSTLPLTRKAWLEAGAAVVERADADTVTIGEALGMPGAANTGAWVVVDRYDQPERHVARARSEGFNVLALDDTGMPPADATLVLNAASSDDGPRVRTLAGPSFATVRSRMLRARARRAGRSAGRRLLVIAGGTDPTGLAPRLVAAARERGFETFVPLASGAHADERAAAARAAGATVVFDADVPELLVEADFALAAAGSIAFELCAVGVPAGLVVTAVNQRGVYRTLVEAGACCGLGEDASLSTDDVHAFLASMRDDGHAAARAAAAMRVVDGRGADRVLNAMTHPTLFVRRAHGDADGARLFTWANDAETRAQSFSTEPISWEAHVSWYARKLGSPSCLLLIGESPKGAIGQARFDLDGDQAVISVGVDASSRGGVGAALIAASVEELFLSTAVATVVAEIKPSNAVSIRAFEKAGFTRLVDGRRGEARIVRMMRART